MKTALGIIIAVALFISLTACDSDPTKRGGGGKQQPYNPQKGTYK